MSTGPALYAPRAKIPVVASFKAGWLLLWSRLWRILVGTWPLLLLIAVAHAFLGPYTRFSPIEGPETFLIDLPRVFVMNVPEFLLQAMLAAKVLRLALGRESPAAFFRLEFGPDEVRISAIWFMLLVASIALAGGSYIFVLQAFFFLQDIGIIVGAKIDPEHGILENLQSLTFYGNLLVSGVILFGAMLLVWFVLRFSLASSLVISERRFGIFSAMSLTRGSTWRQIPLFLLVYGTITLVNAGLALLLGDGIDWRDIFRSWLDPADYGQVLYDGSQRSFLPAWFTGPAVYTLQVLIGSTVSAGAFAYAYLAVRPEGAEAIGLAQFGAPPSHFGERSSSY